MKLKPREQEVPSSPLTLDVPGKLHGALEDYSRYYEASHGHAIAIDLMAVDILSAFVATDYGFKKWRRERAGKIPRKVSKPPRGNSHGSAGADAGEGR
jgi:hypothetical protein